ncbi:response regulator transcription factor [Rhodopirellula sp. MGV]|uniref:response regulator transcription factor n=1 Tax=Rhodopirellula sp. MGV TaxID=2023130 RepID=UPI000B97667D|nr:response regulator transcription factor [Rhodopirellula sp. MGV]OYP38253.1 DNA-binding response regulator [Rhodopirellula sp. MGV]PNY38591.1 DNA-binding response regulator [Rhodopirellula baltica]
MSIRLLVIEDEPGIADFLVRGLSDEGYSVEHVDNGVTAWLRLKTEQWDLVLLDWWLPGEEGIQVLRRFRQIDRTTPVLFLTARDGLDERVTGLDSGADDYLVKPFAFEELVARIRALLRRKDQTDANILEYSDIALDLTRQRATRAGVALDLTAKELLLLSMFLRHPNRVLSRTRIYETVWEDDFDGVSNTLEVHIKELRRKLEQFGNRVIQTRRGLGYILETAAAE